MMRIFAKLVFIANLAFYISLVMRLIEKSGKLNVPIANPVVEYIVGLGLISIFLNITFTILFFWRYSKHRLGNLPRIITYINLISLPAQIVYYFILD